MKPGDTVLQFPPPSDDVKRWEESQGFIEKVIDMARRVTSEVQRNPDNTQAVQQLAAAKRAMAVGDWEKAMSIFMEMVGGKGTVANKATTLGAWADDVLLKASLLTDAPAAQNLGEWATATLQKADAYASVVIESAVRQALYDEMYHKAHGLSDELLCEHAADSAITTCAYKHQSELKAVVANGGRQAIVDMCKKNIDSVRRIAETRNGTAADDSVALSVNGIAF